MYDFGVGPREHPEIAIECVADADEDLIRTGKKVTKPSLLPIRGDWHVELSKIARVKSLKKKLPAPLNRLHAAGVFHFDTESNKTNTSVPGAELAALGVESCYCFNPEGSGRVHGITVGLPGGSIDPTGADLSEWVTRFVRRPDQEHRLRKLADSGAIARHLCIIITFNGTSTVPILDHFLGTVTLPKIAPGLPPEATGIWLLALGTGTGMFWDLRGWHVVDAHLES